MNGTVKYGGFVRNEGRPKGSTHFQIQATYKGEMVMNSHVATDQWNTGERIGDTAIGADPGPSPITVSMMIISKGEFGFLERTSSVSSTF